MAITYHAGRRIQGLAATDVTVDSTTNTTWSTVYSTSSTDMTHYGGEHFTATKWRNLDLKSFTIKYAKYGSGSGTHLLKVFGSDHSTQIGSTITGSPSSSSSTATESAGGTDVTFDLTGITSPNTEWFIGVGVSGTQTSNIRFNNAAAGDGSNFFRDVNGYTDYTSQSAAFTLVYVGGDTKPTDVQVGSRFEETDTRKMYHYTDPLILEDNFNATQWVSTDISKLNVSSGALDFQKSGSEKISYDLGASSVSDSAFVLRAKLNITTHTQGDATFIGVVMSADTNSGNTAGEWLGLSMSTDQDVFSAQSAESGVLSQGSTGDKVLNLGTGIKYLEITRLSTTSYKVELFSDSGFSTSLGSQTKTILSSLGSFRYIKVMNRHGTGGNLVGTLDDIEFWNGVTTASGTATHSDNFSTYWEQNTTGTTNIAVANSKVEYDVTDSGTSQSTLVYDLGTANISEDKWLLRGKSVINNYSSTSGSSCHLFCGLSNGSKTVYFDGSQNSISFAIGVGTNDTAYYLGSGVNGAMYSMTNHISGNITHTPTAETVYFEIIRNNATSATIKLYTDSTYTTSPSGYSRTLTLSSAPTGLRYLVFKSRDRSIASQSLDGYVDDIKFYNGVTSIGNYWSELGT
jgi:hypothetical protein